MMRRIKLILLSACFLLSYILSGCLFSPKDNSDADLSLLKEAAQTLSLPETADSDITFPALDNKYSAISLSYTSGNTDVISSGGAVSRQDEDVLVKITALLKLNSSQYEKSFNVRVPKKDSAADPVPPEESLSMTIASAALAAAESADSVEISFKLSGTLICDNAASERIIKLKMTAGTATVNSYNSTVDGALGSFGFEVPLKEYAAAAEKTIALTLVLKEDGGEEKEISVSSDTPVSAEGYGINKDEIKVSCFSLFTVDSVLEIKASQKDNPQNAAINDKIKLLSDTVRLNGLMSAKGLNSLTADILLPVTVTGGYNSAVSWASSRPSVISDTGAVTRPWVGQVDAALNLSALITRGTLTQSKSFATKVLANTSKNTFSGVKLYQTLSGSTFTELSPSAFSSGSASGTVIDIDSSVTYNEIEGGGGMLSHGAAYLLRNAAADKRAQILNALFSEDGAGFKVVRLPIGASDFPTYVGAEYDAHGNRTQNGVLQNFTLCDTEGPQNDPLQNFSLDIDMQELIPVIKEMRQINPGLIFSAAPWSAPAWMKTSGSLCGGWLMGPNNVKNYESVYCDYLLKYIEGYAEQGIKISYLSLQNEAMHQSGEYPTMEMHYDTQKRLAKELDTKLKAKGLDTKIIILDHNTDMADYAVSIINDSKINGYADRIGVGIHGYSPTLTVGGEYESFISAIRAVKPDIEFYFTEMTAGNSGSAAGNLNWAMQNILMPSYNLGAKFTMYFNFVLDENGMPFIRTDWINDGFNCIGLIELNSSGEISYKPEFYALKHLTKFSGAVKTDEGAERPENARRVKAVMSGSPDTNFMYTASMRADGLISVTAHNQNGSYPKNITLKYNGKILSATLAVNSVTTFTWYA